MIYKSDVLVVIPAYNEEVTISKVVIAVVESGFSCVVVNDGSKDNTAKFAKQSGATVLSLPFNAGVGGALRCGFRFAVENGYKAAIQFDADGQHNSRYIQNLIHCANSTNADFIVGSRFRSQENKHDPSVIRRLAMWRLARIASRATGVRITDATSGFRLIRIPLLGELSTHLPSYYLGDTFETLFVIGRAGYVVEEIGVAMAPRQNGSSSASNWHATMHIFRCWLAVRLGLCFTIKNCKAKESEGC